MLSERAKKISPSETMEINAKVAELKKKGENPINLSIGEPDFSTPENIKNAATEALKNDFTKYSPVQGYPDLIHAIIAKFKRDNNIEYDEKEIIVSAGAKHTLMNIMLTLLNERDEVIIPVPYWVSYPEQVKLAQGVPVFTRPSIKITSDLINEKISKKTKMIILNSPNNPSGAVIEKEELEKIAELAVANNIYVVSDEVYEKMIYGNKHISIASLNDEIKKLTITVNAVSKTYAMTGWRIGYCGANEELTKAMGKIQGQMTSGVCSISQKAAVEALIGEQNSVQLMQKEFEKRRDYIFTKINEIKNLHCELPLGAFYAFVDISKTGYKSKEFCSLLLDKAKVATVPGFAFGMDDRIRISYATSMQNIDEGVKRIKEFCEYL